MFEDVTQRQLDLEMFRDRLANISAMRVDWCALFCQYLERLMRND